MFVRVTGPAGDDAEAIMATWAGSVWRLVTDVVDRALRLCCVVAWSEGSHTIIRPGDAIEGTYWCGEFRYGGAEEGKPECPAEGEEV